MLGYTTTTIYEGYAGLHFRKGMLVGVLPAGAHHFFGGGHRVHLVDLRPATLVIGAQDMTSQDGGTFRVSAVLVHQIDDPALHYRSGQSDPNGPPKAAFAMGAATQLHYELQIALRDWITSRTFREAFDQRAVLAEDVLPAIQSAAATIGIKVRSIKVLDFGVTGSLRTATSDLLKVQMEGEAALARARNEAATMRSLLNTARLTQEHPGLLELRVLSSGQKPRVTFVVGNARDTDSGVVPLNPEA